MTGEKSLRKSFGQRINGLGCKTVQRTKKKLLLCHLEWDFAFPSESGWGFSNISPNKKPLVWQIEVCFPSTKCETAGGEENYAEMVGRERMFCTKFRNFFA